MSGKNLTGSNKKKRRSGKVDIDRTIQTEFKDAKLETEVVAYLLKEKPFYASLFDAQWFTSTPLMNFFKVAQHHRATFSKRSILHELKVMQLMPSTEKDLYEEFATKIYKADISVLNPSNIEIVARQLLQLYESRQCILGMKDILLSIHKFDLDTVKEKLKELSRPAIIDDRSKYGEYTDDLDSRIETVRERRERAMDEDAAIGIPTGIQRLDSQIGGLLNGEFVVLLGRPGIGKTAMMLDMSIYPWLHHNKNIMFATGEMSKPDLEFRMDANICGISTSKFRTGSMSDKEIKAWRDKVEGIKSMQEAFYEIISFPRNFNLDMVEDRAKQVQEKHGQPIHMIVLDYINIAVPNSQKQKGEWASQSDVVWDFKAFCADFNGGIPGLTAGQIRDDYIDAERLDLGAAKYARAISETAPIVIGLVRTEDDLLDDTLQVQMLKMRNAGVSSKPIILRPNLDLMRMDSVQHIKRKSLLDLDLDILKERAANKPKRRSK